MATMNIQDMLIPTEPDEGQMSDAESNDIDACIDPALATEAAPQLDSNSKHEGQISHEESNDIDANIDPALAAKPPPQVDSISKLRKGLGPALYVCTELCGKAYNLKEDWAAHQQTVHDVKWACETCLVVKEAKFPAFRDHFAPSNSGWNHLPDEALLWLAVALGDYFKSKLMGGTENLTGKEIAELVEMQFSTLKQGYDEKQENIIAARGLALRLEAREKRLKKIDELSDYRAIHGKPVRVKKNFPTDGLSDFVKSQLDAQVSAFLTTLPAATDDPYKQIEYASALQTRANGMEDLGQALLQKARALKSEAKLINTPMSKRNLKENAGGKETGGTSKKRKANKIVEEVATTSNATDAGDEMDLEN